MSSLFEDFGISEPVAQAPSKAPTTIKGGRQDNPGIRRLNLGPYDWRQMLLISPENRTMRGVEVDVNALSAKGADLREGGWVDPRYLVEEGQRPFIQATFDATAEAYAAYMKVQNFQISKALYLARQNRADFQRQLAVEKELGA